MDQDSKTEAKSTDLALDLKLSLDVGIIRIGI
jgi:hypothetical protein